MQLMRLVSLLVTALVLAPLGRAQRVIAPDTPFRLERTPRRPAPQYSALFAPIEQGRFVERDGSLLLLNGLPFRFAGNNTYYLQADLVYGRQAGVEETLDDMVAQGLNVARANAHNDHPPASDPAVIQTLPGVYVESSLVALDRSIALARSRNIRLILKLTNNWEAYGGIKRYVQWLLNRTPTATETALFYTDATIKGWFKNYVRMVVERRNTVTGTLYRDEPAILAWELGNELRNPAGNKASDLLAWSAEMAAYLKQIDPNHMVADGGEGFDDSPALYPGLSNGYTVSGSEGCSYHRLVQIPDIDMVSYHLYPKGWGLNDTTDPVIWIRRHEQMAREAGKVAYFGEFGKRANDTAPAGCSRDPGRAFDPQRAVIFQNWLATNVLDEASAGHMVWQMINDAKDDCEGFQVYCPLDTATCAALKALSDRVLVNQPAGVNGASYRLGTIAPGSFASLFGAQLPEAAAQVAVVDYTGQERPAQLFYSGPTQINFLTPAGTRPGGAVLRIYSGNTLQTSALINVASVAPGLFSASADGQGLAAAVVTTVHPDGTQTYELATTPITLAADGTIVVVSFYGTGIRNVSGAEQVTATINGTALEVLYAGAQSEYPGLDQVNVKLPPSLAGSGEVDVTLTIAGKPANTVRLNIR